MSMFVMLTVHTLVYNMSSDSHVTDTEDSLRRMVRKQKTQAEREERVGESEKKAEAKF